MKKILMLPCLLIFGIIVLTTTGMRSAGPPQVTISNGIIEAKLYLPDVKEGYYRGSRFDWSGVISSLKYKGHQYHGQWFQNYNPTTHDAIMGPVEEFAPLRYDEAKTGETFVKIGVGSLIKPAEQQYAFSKSYTIADPGKWKVNTKSNEVQFLHSFVDKEYGYAYTKTVKLIKGKPQMVLAHELTNKGTRTMQTTVYNHHFFVIDNQPTGPGYEITLPVSNLSAEGGKGVGDVVQLQGNKIVYLRNLAQREQAYFPDLAGGVDMTYDITVEHLKTGAGVKIKGDRPVSKMVFWSSPTNVSPEPYLNILLEPGKTFTWKINYEYYTISDSKVKK